MRGVKRGGAGRGGAGPCGAGGRAILSLHGVAAAWPCVGCMLVRLGSPYWGRSQVMCLPLCSCALPLLSCLQRPGPQQLWWVRATQCWGKSARKVPRIVPL